MPLAGGRETHESFEILDTKTLRHLDREGKPIESTLNYELQRTEVFAPLEPGLAQ